MCNKIVLYLYICLLSFVSVHALSCKDENDRDVDWFIAYKIPKVTDSDELKINDGYSYIYVTSENYNSWILSSLSIANDSSIIGRTLQEWFQKRESLSYIVYNNEPPERPKCSTKGHTKGHTKGIVVTDSNAGFWLVHSVPLFPELKDTYSFPSSGEIYGQTFLCISMDVENINKVGLQLQYNQPLIYLQNIVSNVESSIPDIVEAANNVTINTAPWYHVAQIYSGNRVEFISFAKHANYASELYVDLVAPYLKSDLVVETWPNGPGRLKSNCSEQYNVNNIKSIAMSSANVTFTTTKDHSKWAVSSTSSKTTWSCIGDINRAEHQEVRGGGTVCLHNNRITKNFQKLISSIEECIMQYFYEIPVLISV